MLKVILLLACLAQDDGRFFKKPDVDFWHTRKPKPAPQELFRDLDPPVSDLLNNPTEENARRYLDWQRERLARIRQAARLLEKLETSGIEITYHKKPGCKACDVQDLQLPDLPFRVVLNSPHVAKFPTWTLRDPTTGRTVQLEGVQPPKALRAAALKFRQVTHD